VAFDFALSRLCVAFLFTFFSTSLVPTSTSIKLIIFQCVLLLRLKPTTKIFFKSVIFGFVFFLLSASKILFLIFLWFLQLDPTKGHTKF